MKKIPALALGAALMSGGFVVAQQAGEPPGRQPAAERQTERQTERRAGRQGENASDRMFANCLAIDSATEAQISEFAAQRLQEEQAKQFAQMMVRDHRALVEKLGQFGAEPVSFKAGATTRAGAQPGGAAVPAERTETSAQADRAGQPGATRGEVRTEHREGGHPDFVGIKREIAQEIVRTAEEELTAKPANEVDRCYMASQVFAHQHALAALKVLERHASPDFKQTLAQASQTTQQHLDQAKEILKALEAKHGGAESPATTSGTTSR